MGGRLSDSELEFLLSFDEIDRIRRLDVRKEGDQKIYMDWLVPLLEDPRPIDASGVMGEGKTTLGILAVEWARGLGRHGLAFKPVWETRRGDNIVSYQGLEIAPNHVFVDPEEVVLYTMATQMDKRGRTILKEMHPKYAHVIGCAGDYMEINSDRIGPALVFTDDRQFGREGTNEASATLYRAGHKVVNSHIEECFRAEPFYFMQRDTNPEDNLFSEEHPRQLRDKLGHENVIRIFLHGACQITLGCDNPGYFHQMWLNGERAPFDHPTFNLGTNSDVEGKSDLVDFKVGCGECYIKPEPMQTKLPEYLEYRV